MSNAATTSSSSRTVGSRHDRRISTETKASYKTTEFIAYIAVVVAIAIASQTIGSDSGASGGGDYFRADKAFLYIVIVTVGYLVSRGLAKSGSRNFYDDTVDLDRDR